MDGKDFLNRYIEQRLPGTDTESEEPGRYLPGITNDFRDLPLRPPPYGL